MRERDSRPASSATVRDRERPRSEIRQRERESRPSSTTSHLSRPDSMSRLDSLARGEGSTSRAESRAQRERRNSHREKETRTKTADREVEIEIAQDEQPEESTDRLLDGVPLDVQEAWICEDLTFVLQVCAAIVT